MLAHYTHPRRNYLNRCQWEAEREDLRGKHVLIIGGTQGIGASVARRFAILKCRVSIAGRNEARAKRILWEANLGNPGPMGKFYKVNLESMHDIERFTDEVKQDFKDKGIDYLILSAGGPPSGIWRPGLGGMEKAFAVQCMSRFYATYRLLPVIKESVVVIGSPGHGAFYDETDPGFEKPENRKAMSLIRQGQRDSLFLDAIFKEFSIRNPNITFHHLFPGLVRTNALENQGWSPRMVTIGRIFGKFFATDPDRFCDVPVAKAVSKDNKGGLQLSGYWGGNVALEKWAQDEEKRKQLFEWALQRAQTAAREEAAEEAAKASVTDDIQEVDSAGKK